MVKKCKILYILSCFPWRLVKSVKGGMWRLLCFAFCICIALLRHCFAFAFALQTSRLTRGSEKFWGDCCTAQLVALFFALSQGGGKRQRCAISWYHCLRRVLGWKPGAEMLFRGSFRFFPPVGRESACSVARRCEG
jgi:hypothetical protein